jgi:hypothetical protein
MAGLEDKLMCGRVEILMGSVMCEALSKLNLHYLVLAYNFSPVSVF